MTKELPMNSYEVSFLVKVYKPHWAVDITFEELNRLICRERREELLDWASEYITQDWLQTKSPTYFLV